MNMKCNHSWLLVACILIGQMLLPTQGSKLQWANSIGVTDGEWHFTLLDVPSNGHTRWDVTLYHKEPSGQFVPVKTGSSEEILEGKPMREKVDVLFKVNFNGASKIVKAKVVYPNADELESEIFDLDNYVMTIVVVVCVVGGVCLIAAVVGCVLCKRRRRRRVPFQQPVAAIGQGQVYQTQPQVVGQGQNYRVPQAVPQDSIV